MITEKNPCGPFLEDWSIILGPKIKQLVLQSSTVHIFKSMTQYVTHSEHIFFNCKSESSGMSTIMFSSWFMRKNIFFKAQKISLIQVISVLVSGFLSHVYMVFMIVYNYMLVYIVFMIVYNYMLSHHLIVTDMYSSHF